MAERSLPPQVDGPSQGRLDMIIGRPSVFPTPSNSQTFIFTYRWWGDTRPCVLRSSPNKSETRVTYHVTCSPRSFRQYLLDAGSLHVSVRIEGEGKTGDTEEEKNISRELQNLKRTGIETPRQKLLKRQLRQRKGWQDGDVVGSFMLPDMKLNTRGDYVRECRIVDSSADVVGTIIVNLVFMEGSPDDLHHLKLTKEEGEISPNEMAGDAKSKSRPSGIPIREANTSKIPKSTGEGYRQRSRSSSFRNTQGPKAEALKSPKRQAGCSQVPSYKGKENETPPKVTEVRTEPAIEDTEPRVVRRRERIENQGVTRERPASWGLYPLLNGTDPYSLVESGAIRKEELPVLLQVLEGRSPTLDLSHLDPDTKKLLDGLDLSMSFSGISGVSSEGAMARGGLRPPLDTLKPQPYSVFNQDGATSFSGLSMTSGVWPIEDTGRDVGQGRDVAQGSPRSPRKHSQTTSARTKSSGIPGGPGVSGRPLTPRVDRQGSRDDDTIRKTPPPQAGRRVPEDVSVLVVDVGTLVLSPVLLPTQPQEKKDKIRGAKVMLQSRVCYLTSLEVKLPGVDIPPEWDFLQQTCASRQLTDNEIHYRSKEVLRLPPAPAMEILKGQLDIRSVCRHLGEKDSEEVGSVSVSMMDIWQLSGSEVQVPLFRSEVIDGRDSLTKRRKAKRKDEGEQRQSYANLTFTPKLSLVIGESSSGDLLLEQWALQQKKNLGEASMPAGGGLHNAAVPKENFSLSRLKEKGYTQGIPGTPPHHLTPRGHRSIHDKKEGIRALKPEPVPPESYEPLGSAVFNSIYLPTHVSPREKIYASNWQHPKPSGRVEVVESFLGTPMPTKVVSHDPSFRVYQGPFLAGINGHEAQSNEPIESGGESPCIRTLGDFHADFIEHALLNRRSSVEMRQEENRGSCRVHLEILKGRNFPWVEGVDGTPKRPSCYVRATIGSHNIQTNICLESDNPMWNFAADVLLPYSQLSQTDGNLILKVHHGTWDQPPSLEDPLMGFVCVDATSIWSGHVSLCGWYPLLDLRGCVRGHLKVSLTPHEPPQSGGPTRKACYSVSLQDNLSSKVPPDPHYPRHPDKGIKEKRSDTASRRESLRPVSSNIMPRYSPKSQRKSYSNDNKMFHVTDTDTYVDSSTIFSKGSIMSSGSVIIDGKVLNDVSGLHDELTKVKASTHDSLHGATVSLESKASSFNKKYSNIPVFSPRKNEPMQGTDNKVSIVLPERKEKENVIPNTSVHSQPKDSMIVKGIKGGKVRDAEGKGEEGEPVGLPYNERSGSNLLRDSVIISHARMQKEESKQKEEEINQSIQSKGPPSPRYGSKETAISAGESSQSQPLDAHRRGSTTIGSDKPSSCLKVPGSPSLRAKHVTFAHRLVQQDKNKKPGELLQQSHDMYSLADETLTVHSTEGQLRSPRVTLERSDLQVVPCREGDTQVVTTTAGVQGSKAQNILSGIARRSSSEVKTTNSNIRSDLIMQFSWMNQGSGSDTPCVSFIDQRQNIKESHTPGKNMKESHIAVKNIKEAHTGGKDTQTTHSRDNTSSPKTTQSGSPQKKSRKLRSRLAANFHLK